MITKIAYCLISDNKDYYYEQLLISLVSLRKHNPEATIIVVCDRDTHKTLQGTRLGVFRYAEEVIPIDVPTDWNKVQRSRYLKTNLRSIICGDFLYVDTDTIICAPLGLIDTFRFDVGAVYDSHVTHPIPSKVKHETEIWIKGEADKVGKDITGLWQFNGGLMYVKDSPTAQKLYKRWYELYKEHQTKGSLVDQLPLMLANKELGEIITPMDPSLNCQVSFKEGRENVHNAKIIHYFPGQMKTILSSPWILDPIKETGKIPCTVQRIIDNPYSFFKTESKIVFGDAAVGITSRSQKVLNAFISFIDKYHKP